MASIVPSTRFNRLHVGTETAHRHLASFLGRSDSRYAALYVAQAASILGLTMVLGPIGATVALVVWILLMNDDVVTPIQMTLAPSFLKGWRRELKRSIARLTSGRGPRIGVVAPLLFVVTVVAAACSPSTATTTPSTGTTAAPAGAATAGPSSEATPIVSPSAGGVPSPDPAEPAIAFVCLDGDTSAICVSDRDGGHVRTIAQGDDHMVDPVWSPDGKTIAFVCLFQTDTPPAFDDWVHFGITGFARSRGGEICTVRPDGSDLRTLTKSGGHAIAPAWSPDSRTIAYSVGLGVIDLVRNGQPTPPPPDPEKTPGVHLVDVASGSVRQLTQGSSDDMPAWSHDGTEIAFTSQAETKKNAFADIAVADVETGSVRYLTRTADYELAPAWSPDDRLVAAIRFAFSGRPRQELVIVPSAGGAEKACDATDPIDPNDVLSYEPHWTVDGRRVVYTAWRAATDSITVSSATSDCTDAHAIVGKAPKSFASQPAVAPDGKSFAYAYIVGDERLRIRVASLDGTDDHDLFPKGISAQPAWRPSVP